ncbi:MAG: hypothetical protein ACK5P7_02245 [Bdellovibrio sp.]
MSTALVALAWVSRPSFCLDSKLVEKVDKVGLGPDQSLPSCFVSRDTSYSGDLAEIKALIEPRLSRLEKELQFFGVEARPIRLSVVDSFDPLVRVHPSHLIMSRSVLGQNQLFEKAFVLSLLMQKSRTSPHLMNADDVAWAEVFSDLFLAFTQGDLDLRDPVLNQQIAWQGPQIEWPLALKTAPAYCQEAWRSMLHLSACEQGLLNGEDLFVSLRPLIGKALFDGLEKQPLDERVQFFRNTFKDWSSMQIQKYSFGSSVGSPAEQQFADAASSLENWLKNFKVWGGASPAWKKMARQFNTELQARGFGVDSRALVVDLIVVGSEDEKEPLLQKLAELALQDPSKKILYLSDKEARLLPDVKPFPRSWLKGLQARQAMLIQCRIPSVERLKTMADTVERLLVVRDCQSPMALEFKVLLTGGLDAFVSANPNMKFVQFHLPSLKSALAKQNLNPIPLLEEKRWASPFFLNIGWEKPEWDKRLKVYRARAAIDAIEMYRGTETEETLPL